MPVRRLATSATIPIILYVLVLAAAVAGLGLPLLPGRSTTDERLDAFPSDLPGLVGPAEILWNDHQVPFVIAERDEDVPYLMGSVHAHLRRGQMEFYRLVAKGRLAEVAGPMAADIDQSIRTFDLDRAVPEIEATLPEATRAWLTRYVEGINDEREHGAGRPAELRLLGVPDEPWTVRDVLTLGRLLSIDVNWLRWYGLLRIRLEPEYPRFLGRLRGHATAALPSFGSREPVSVEHLFRLSRPGSNSVVVSPSRSATGGALIANDPHLGLQQPNLWLIAGYRSPAGASVGFMYPGIPVVLIGRNETIAWGGTNMASTSSTLFDVSRRPADSFTTRREEIRVRFGTDRAVDIRESDLGPVVSDAPLLAGLGLPDTALKWRGHTASDEATPMLLVNRAKDFDAFRAAFATYAVSGQNLLYADAAGTIGQLMAIEFVPAAGRTVSQLPADPDREGNRWGKTLTSPELPAARNPAAGYLVSCNNVPARIDPPIGMFGNANDRYRRYSRLIEEAGKISVEDLMGMQRDVRSEAGARAAHAFARRRSGGPVAEVLAGWNGDYAVNSRGALAWQLVLDGLIDSYYARRYGPRIAAYLRASMALQEFAGEDIASRAIPATDLAAAEEAARAAVDAGRTWGDHHRLRVAHPLGSIPVIGRRFRYGAFPVPGSGTTILKSAHAVTDDPHVTTFGQNSRHVSDLSDPDANWFVLFGGQDGWPGSEDLLDQVSLWREGAYLKIPLREASVRAAFPRRMVFTAGGAR